VRILREILVDKLASFLHTSTNQHSISTHPVPLSPHASHQISGTLLTSVAHLHIKMHARPTFFSYYFIWVLFYVCVCRLFAVCDSARRYFAYTTPACNTNTTHFMYISIYTTAAGAGFPNPGERKKIALHNTAHARANIKIERWK
jgi:hypothetical protein